MATGNGDVNMGVVCDDTYRVGVVEDDTYSNRL